MSAVNHVSFASAGEESARSDFHSVFERCPIPPEEMLANLALFIKRQDLSRILFLDELYRKIVGVHGVIMEFGVRWGRDLAVLNALRGMYEPYNYLRKVVGFDTFEGFPSVDEKDGASAATSVGGFSVTQEYEEYLREVMDYHETESPISHIPKYELRKGDASVTVREYLDEHPETIVALAYFDLDIYEPTRNCLEAIRPYITRGTVLAFDELGCDDFPGETVALREVLGLDRYRIERSPIGSTPSYVIVD